MDPLITPVPQQPQCMSHQLMEQNIKDLQENQRELAIQHGEQRERLVKAETAIGDIKALVEGVNALTAEIKVQNTELKHVVETLGDHENRLDEVEQAPARNWRNLMYGLVAALLITAVTSVTTMAVNNIFEGGKQDEIQKQIEELRTLVSDHSNDTNASEGSR